VSTKIPRATFTAALAALAIGYCVTGAAQEGHPLKGSWLGTWAENAVHGNNVLLILDWDGEKITGMINPGTDNIPIGAASLDPEGWVVRLEARAEDGSGDVLNYVIEGRIENLELATRSISGTWRNERGNGVFEVGRQ
jgi:hypothetical protein